MFSNSLDPATKKNWRDQHGKKRDYHNQNKRPDVYHNVKALFKIYRSVSWRMQVQMKQVSHQFRKEYGVDVDEFLDSIYQAGMDLNEEKAYIQARVEAINSSHQFLQLIDESVELMRQYHPQGERNYWVLYYTYICPYKPANIAEIIAKVESICRKTCRLTAVLIFAGEIRH